MSIYDDVENTPASSLKTRINSLDDPSCDEFLPTKDWQKKKRKEDYERFKKKVRADKQLLKEQKIELKKNQQAARDQELWALLKPAKDLE